MGTGVIATDCTGGFPAASSFVPFAGPDTETAVGVSSALTVFGTGTGSGSKGDGSAACGVVGDVGEAVPAALAALAAAFSWSLRSLRATAAAFLRADFDGLEGSEWELGEVLSVRYFAV